MIDKYIAMQPIISKMKQQFDKEDYYLENCRNEDNCLECSNKYVGKCPYIILKETEKDLETLQRTLKRLEQNYGKVKKIILTKVED